MSHRKIALWALLLLCAAQTLRAALFALDPYAPEHAVFPFDSFHQHHSCFTAYFEGARLLDDVPNIYDTALYLAQPGASDRPSWQSARDTHRTMAAFYVDAYEYPPPFLLLSRPIVALVGGDFVRARAIWFFLLTALVLGALLLLALQLGSQARTRFAWLAALVYLSLPVQTTLQIGNFQVAALALALIAMVAIARGHEVVGSALLTFASLAKLFPFVLLILLFRRANLRLLLLNLACLGGWIGLAAVSFGWAPFEAFWNYHLPRIASGDAFPQLRIPFAIAVNHSVRAIPLKLHLFGIGSGTQQSGAVIAALYTVVPFAAAWWLRRASSAPLAWALLLGLATYCAPFLPPAYASIGPLLTLCILAAIIPMSRARWAAFAVSYVLLQLEVPWETPNELIVNAIATVVAQCTAAAVFVAAFRVLFAQSRCSSVGLSNAQPRPGSRE